MAGNGKALFLPGYLENYSPGQRTVSPGKNNAVLCISRAMTVPAADRITE